jgi:putative transcriptional regulator
MTASLLGDYVAGRADDPAMALLAKTTAAMRTDATYVERADDAAGAVFLDDETPAAMAPEAFDRVLGLIDAAEARDRAAQGRVREDPRRHEIARLPSPLREIALDALDQGRWRFAGLGIRRLPLPIPGADGHAELMRIEPGRGVAAHAHGGDEVTLVLTGSYFDGFAHYAPGDVSLAQGEFRHAPKADPGEVCYVLAVSYGPPLLGGLYGLIERLSR